MDFDLDIENRLADPYLELWDKVSTNQLDKDKGSMESLDY